MNVKKIVLWALGGLLAAATLVGCDNKKDVMEIRYLASATATAPIYALNDEGAIVEAKSMPRGSQIVVYPNQSKRQDDRVYLKTVVDTEVFYADAATLTPMLEKAALEKTVWVRTPATIIADPEKSTIAGFADKGSQLEVLGHNGLKPDGNVDAYHIRMGDVEGYVYGKYTTLTPEEAAMRYGGDEYDKIHKAIKNPFGGGEAVGCDFWPQAKPTFEDNPMPEACYTLYLNSSSNVLKNIEAYIEIAKQSKINAFVIDIKDNEVPGYMADAMKEYSPTNYKRAGDKEELYKKVVDRLHQEGFYVIGRITCFKDSYFVNDNPQCAITEKATGKPFKHNKAYWPSGYDRRVWEFNVALAKESVRKFGFNEINFDYVRFPDKMTRVEDRVDYHNLYNESKVQAIQRFVQYACDELHKEGVYVSIDVFGEVANPGYTTAYGQYWPAISNVADVMSGMPYPDHFSNGYYGITKPWNQPRKLLGEWGKRVQGRQEVTPSPAIVRTWVQAYKVMRHVDKNGLNYDAEDVEQEIRGLYDADLTGGYMTWHSGSNVEKYRAQLGAYKIDYLSEWKERNNY